MDVGAHGNMAATNQEQHFVDILKGRIQKIKGVDSQVKEFVKKEKVKRKKIVDSDLQDFMN